MGQLSVSKPLRSIREHLGLSRSALSRGICTQDYINMIEAGLRSPALDKIGKIAERLCCDAADLLEMPSELRLKEIAAAYQQRQADLAAAELAAAKGVA